jgi:uncharacterized protein with ParB-like and HNH nuclease domain
MSITSRPMSIQEAYDLYRQGKFIVNRAYQRKLIWRVQEKQNLINSILNKYPIPLFLLANSTHYPGEKAFEIIDGMQRLNAIMSFIENFYSVEDKYFDTAQFLAAKIAAEEGLFQAKKDGEKLSPKQCSEILNYQLAVTIYSASSENEITEVFGRINSGGKQLSPQEKRQAGTVNNFSEVVKKIAAKLRGDDTGEILLLQDMPSISIDSKFERQGYGVPAEDTIWIRQGILSLKQLRNSEDEQIIADIAASILFGEPLAASMDLLDKLYDESSEEYKKLENSLSKRSAEKLSADIEKTFSILRSVIESYSDSLNCLRQTINQSQIKTPFFAIFMSFYDLIINKELSPIDSNGIMESLKDVKLKSSSKNTTTKDRRNNINKVKGLIQDYFAKAEPLDKNYGPGLEMGFENQIRRSRIECPAYELKQGVVSLDPNKRCKNEKLMLQVVETICAIANLGPSSEGYIFVGVADKIADSKMVERLDRIKTIEVPGSGRHVVGIEREAKFLGVSVEQYIETFINFIRNSDLSEPLKTEITAGNIDHFSYKHLYVIKITIPSQKDVSYVDGKVFIRDNSSTIELKTNPEIVSLTKRFSSL